MKFLLTKELGRLARWLRILGFDAVYHDSDNLGTLIIQALRDNRIIVTRRKAKVDDLEKKTVIIHSDKIQKQLQEVKAKLNLVVDEGKMFTRCTVCNETLKSVKKEEIKAEVPPYAYENHDAFMRCKNCRRVYWQGTHWGNVNKALKKLGIT